MPISRVLPMCYAEQAIWPAKLAWNVISGRRGPSFVVFFGQITGGKLDMSFRERALRNIARSLRLNVGRPYHLAPLLSFVSNVLGEVGGRAGKHRDAHVVKPSFDLWI